MVVSMELGGGEIMRQVRCGVWVISYCELAWYD